MGYKKQLEALVIDLRIEVKELKVKADRFLRERNNLASELGAVRAQFSAQRAQANVWNARAIEAEKKLRAIDEVQHPKPEPTSDNFEARITWEASFGPAAYGSIVNAKTGRRIYAYGESRRYVIDALRQLDAYETDMSAAAETKVEVTPNTDSLLAEITRQAERMANRVAKKEEERIEDSLMALGWKPPMFSSASERRANLLKLSEREAQRNRLTDALGFRYGCLVRPVSDHSIIKVTGV